MTDEELDAIEQQNRVFRIPPDHSLSSPETVLALVAEVRRLRARLSASVGVRPSVVNPHRCESYDGVLQCELERGHDGDHWAEYMGS